MITIVTGNPGKLKEIQAIAPAELDFQIHNLTLAEIQSLDPQEIVDDKLRRAYDVIGSPVIVEDVSAGLDKMGGLPGPFFKFFEKQLGQTALLELAKQPGDPVTITCVAGYFDGNSMLFGEGTIHGTVVEPRGENGFGFDPIIVPDGETRTMAEMLPEEKNAISHRAQAFHDLLRKLQAAEI